MCSGGIVGLRSFGMTHLLLKRQNLNIGSAKTRKVPRKKDVDQWIRRDAVDAGSYGAGKDRKESPGRLDTETVNPHNEGVFRDT